MLKASLEVLMAENTRITECRDVTTLSLFDDYERFVVTTDSLISVRQNIGDICLVHYMKQPTLKHLSTASLLYCLSREPLR